MRKENIKIGEVYSYSTYSGDAYADPKELSRGNYGLRCPVIPVEHLGHGSVRIFAAKFHPETNDASRTEQATIEQAQKYITSGKFQKLLEASKRVSEAVPRTTAHEEAVNALVAERAKVPTGWCVINAYTVNLKEPWQEYETEHAVRLAEDKARRDAEALQKSIYKDARQRCEDHGFYFKDRLNYGGYFTMRADDVVRLADLLDEHHGTA